MMPVVLLLVMLSGPMALTRPPDLRQGIPGYPRIARPADPAQQRINRTLARLEASLRRSLRECVDESVNPANWQRTVRVTMRGPAFLSYAVEDEVDCGGAHPSTRHAGLVFDLATGRLADWTRLLPRRLHGTAGATRNSDGVAVATLASSRLGRLYAQRYDSAVRKEGGLEDCLGTAQLNGGPGEQPMVAWLDARAGGLVVQYDLGNAMKACSMPVLLPIATLRHEGASPRLIAALTAAHGR